MNEEVNLIKLFTGVLIVSLCLGGLVYWGGLVTQPVANNLQQKARETNPLVINTKQQNALRMLSQIQIKQEEIDNIRQSGGDVTLAQTSLRRMVAELKEQVGTLKQNQIPPTVKEFLESHE